MHGFGAGRGSRHCQPLGSPAQRGMVRDGEVEAKQVDDGADQPFGLPQRQSKHCPQGQRRRNRQGRIARLTAAGGAWLGPPGRDRLFAEPYRQAATLAQGSIIFRPVSHPILLLGDVMTAIGIGLEWHREHPRRLSTGVTVSHLGLFGSLCRPRCFGTVQPDQRPRTPNLASQDRPLRYPAQDPSPTDPCNKVARRQTQPSYRWLAMKASQASRCACSELNSCSSPSSEDLRVYTAQRTAPPRRVAAGFVNGPPPQGANRALAW